MLKVYVYQKCSTCRDALQWLNDAAIPHEALAIRETPPSVNELKSMLKAYDGNIRRLFNTSGMDYRAMGMKEKLPNMSELEALQLLSANGNLVKRPFAIGDETALVGYKSAEWQDSLIG